MKKLKRGLWTILSCMILGAALAPAALAAELLEVPATGDATHNYLPLIIGVAVACLIIIVALVMVMVSSKKKKKQSGEGESSPEAQQEDKGEDNQ